MEICKGILLGFCFLAFSVHGEKNVLKFRNGTFRIMQFTDLHWVPANPEYEEGNKKTFALMDSLIDMEQPDLIVFTGDIVVAGPAREGWESIIKLLNRHKVPFCITFGNHDFEAGTPKEEIMRLLETSSSYFVGSSEKGLPGAGNCVLEVKDSDGEAAAWALYMFDSHDYSPDKKVEGYAWIKNSQIEWYRRKSDSLAQLHGNAPLPSLAFFHIPLPEYEIARKEGGKTYGHDLEAVCAPKINSGLFVSFLEKKDVKGVFVGHDHNNDYLRLYYGIALAYGRKTGYSSAYEELLPRGGRMIVLHENTAVFDTYILTSRGKEQEYFFNEISGTPDSGIDKE